MGRQPVSVPMGNTAPTVSHLACTNPQNQTVYLLPLFFLRVIGGRISLTCPFGAPFPPAEYYALLEE